MDLSSNVWSYKVYKKLVLSKIASGLLDFREVALLGYNRSSGLQKVHATAKITMLRSQFDSVFFLLYRSD